MRRWRTDKHETPVAHDAAVETEWLIQRGRIGALVLALALAVSFGSDRSLNITAAVAVLAICVLGTQLVLRRARRPRTITRVGWASFLADVVVCGLALSSVPDDPVDPVVFVTMVIAVEAAIRWGASGAVGGGLLAGAMGAMWAHSGYEAIDRVLPATSIAFRTLAPVMIALPVGLLVERLGRQRGYTQHLFEQASDPTVIVTSERVVAANAAAAQLVGEPIDQLRGAPFQATFGALLEVPSLEALLGLPASERPDVPVMDEQGRQRWFSVAAESSDDGLVFVTARDVTEERMREQQLSFRAWHDPLTGLPNRAALQSRLSDRLREQTPVGVVFLDLDGFKEINDLHGHQVGDDVLVEVADRVRQVTRDVDAVHRWGGDEFCFALSDADQAMLDAIAERIDEALRPAVNVRGLHLNVGASVGTALARPDDTESTLIRRADEQMYRRKRARVASRSSDLG